MRWSIRNQILLPFVAVVLLAVVAMTVVAAVAAARQRDAQTLAQLQNVLATLEHTSVPFNRSVLEKLHGFSGAHFVACDSAGTVQAATLPVGATLPAAFAEASAAVKLESLSSQPTLVVGDTRYFLARKEPRGDAAVRTLFVLYPVESWSRARWNAAFPPLAVGGGAVLLTAIVSGWLAQSFGGRIRRLQRQFAAIAAGDFSEISAGKRRDEIQELVASVNGMSARLRDMQSTIRHSERERLLAQLAGGLAHQLRNAVAGARMALQLHQRRCAAAPHDQSLAVALRQLSLTETQIKGLLSLGRGERGLFRTCDVNSLVDDVAVLVQPASEHALVVLEVACGPHPAIVKAELESLRAAVLNLATNAIEAAGSGGNVLMAVAQAGGIVAIEISDTGRGPAQTVAESLFDPFVTTKPEGIGLGLALARQVAIEHSGALSWKRDAERTIFRLELPSAPPTESRSEIRNPNSEIGIGETGATIALQR
ncbi:MAG: HAMP domain-containing histidine kinase [Planctomycetia bacterium]|nr:HAMP domain-containing histidine kinase [Planctomycetia bacterium]